MTSPTIVHDIEFEPYAQGAGPVFRITTWYAGVAVVAGGQANAKLGYRLEMDGVPVIDTKPGSEDYIPSSATPFEGVEALAFLMGYLTNDFLMSELVSTTTGAEHDVLIAYQKHVGPLWDAVVARYGDAACYGI